MIPRKVFVLIMGAALALQVFQAYAAPAYRVIVTGPSATRHSGDGNYQNTHIGAGLELQASPDKDSPWNLAAGGHYMDNDSHGRPMWWLGLTPSCTFGDRTGWWFEPGITAGVINKHGLYDGDTGPLALPRIALGYDWLGLDLAYIPAMDMTNNVSIALVMLRMRVGD